MGPCPVDRLHADALAPEILRFHNEFAGNYLLAEDFLFVINVVDETIQCGEPLLQPRFGPLPFLTCNDSWNYVKRPRTIDVLAFAVDGKGDAHRANGEFSRRLSQSHFLRGQ